MNILAVLSKLKDEPSISSLNFNKIEAFRRYSSIIKPSIEASVLDSTHPPDILPTDVQLVLSRILGEDSNTISSLWSAFREDIWEHSTSICGTIGEEEIATFNLHALDYQFSYHHLYPPTRVCSIYSCGNHRDSNDIRTLSDPITHKATLFTLRSGALPVYTTSFYCRKCKRRYHHNNYVHSDTNARHYYSRMPDVVQVAQHYFMDVPLLEFFATSKVFGWLSSLNCARIYNLSLARRHSEVYNNISAYPPSDLRRRRLPKPLNWQSSLELQDAYVLNGFLLYSLLLDKAEHQSILSLEHHAPSQRDRLKTALQVRNSQMEGIGQEGYTHACELCFLVSEDSNGAKTKIHPAVCDGVTIGHPCCAVHDCHIPLTSNHDRYCPQHHTLNLQCSVTDCQLPRENQFRTCSLREHRSLESQYFQKGKALFQLRLRLLKNTGSGITKDSAPLGSDSNENDEETLVEGGDGSCDGKSTLGNRKIKAYFGRRRTHNEELIMRPCGVILSRATFFGSESPSAVKNFAKATFPSPESTPEMFVFDSNCKLLEHIKSTQDQHFKDTGFPVDVFHFRTKHKETDTHCQLYCNPAAFPELIDSENGKWKINMSVCEQGNAWIGGYQAILRDMEATRYNFYLDEMIKRRNRYIIQELHRKGHYPWKIPLETLFPNRQDFLSKHNPI